MTTKGKLTTQDVERLLTDPSAENRARTAAMLAGDFQDGVFTEQERALAVQIFEIMVQDAAVRVRQALADHLKETPDLPRDIALKLAADAGDVAAPILRCSEALTDADLLAIVRASGEAKQSAIAGRAGLSDTVAGSLVEHGSATVVARLMENTEAKLSEATLNRAMDLHGENESVSSAAARRGQLPISVAERLVALATDNLQKQLASGPQGSADSTVDLVLHIRERATLSLVDPRFGIGDPRQLVRSLDERGRLTPSIVLRGLCMGDVAFFEAALAHRAHLPVLNAQILIHDEARRGLRALWAKADMPEPLLPAALAAVEVAEELDYDGGPNDRERYRCRVIERVLTRLAGAGFDLDGVDEGSLDYLLGKLGELRAQAPARA